MPFQLENPTLALIAAFCLACMQGSARAETIGAWPDLYDPFTLRSLQLEMAPGDWTTIVGDTTFDIEVPALLRAEGDEQVLVSVRRKSGELLGKDKVSLKVDINEYHDEDEFGNDICEITGGFADPVCVDKWHGVKKLSLENGDDRNVLTEGMAWYLHRAAAESGLDYTPGLAAWASITVNGDSKGVYVNVEQRDKQFLKNHGLWEGADDTWLYKYSSPDSADAKEAPEDEAGDEIDSPASTELCYSPFRIKRPCAAAADFKERLIALVNMEGLLTFGAVSAFHASPDDLFPKAKNYFIVDYSSSAVGRREYAQWDLDSAFHKPKSIYDQGKGKTDNYEAELVQSPGAPFRGEYEAVLGELLDGPFRAAELDRALQQIELAIGAAVEADPNNQLGDESVTGEFERMRRFFSNRVRDIRAELP